MCASCCGFIRRNAALVVLSVLLAVAVTGWVREATKETPPPAPVEMVEVLVAAKDLHTGQSFTKDNVEKLTAMKTIPKVSLPKEYVTNKEDLIGKRLNRPLRQGVSFHPDDVSKGTPSILAQGKDILSIGLPAATSTGHPAWPGAKVDILACFIDDEERKVFTLLPDMTILEVNDIQEPRVNGVFSEIKKVSFAVDQKQALLIALANHRNCKLELLLRHPDSKPRTDWSYEETLTLLETWSKRPIAPAPRVKGE